MGACGGKSSQQKTNFVQSKKKNKAKASENSRKTDDTINQQTKKPLSQNDEKTSDNVEISSRPRSQLIDFDILIIIDEIEAMSNRLMRSNPNALVDLADPHLEQELLQLVYGNPERDYEENFLNESQLSTTAKL